MNKKETKINTLLDFLGIIFISIGGMCINEISKGCIDFYLCIFSCSFCLLLGITIIYIKYKIRK